MKKIKILLIGIITIAIIAIFLLFSNKSLQVDTTFVTKKHMVDTFSEDGIVSAGTNLDIISQVSGQVTKVYVAPNSYVEKNTLLAEISPQNYVDQKQTHLNNITSYNAQITQAQNDEKNQKQTLHYTLQELESKLAAAENAKKQSQLTTTFDTSPKEYLETLQLNLTVAQSSYDYAHNKLSVYQELLNAGAVSQADFDAVNNDFLKNETALKTAQTAYNVAQKRLNELYDSGMDSSQINDAFYAYEDINAQSNIDVLNIQIANIKSQINSSNSIDMVNQLKSLIKNEELAIKSLDTSISNCKIVAPESGYVKDLLLDSVSSIKENQTVATIKPISNLIITTDVLTSCEPYLSVGDPVTITQKLKNNDVTFSGTITEILDYAEPSTSALGLDEYRIQVSIEPDLTDVALKSGYQVEIEFTMFESDDQLVIPNSSLFEQDQQYYVFTIQNNVAVKTPVEILYKGNTETALASGLAENDEIISIANTESLADNTKVSPIRSK